MSLSDMLICDFSHSKLNLKKTKSNFNDDKILNKSRIKNSNFNVILDGHNAMNSYC